MDYAYFFTAYLGTIILLVIIFSVKNNNNNSITERFWFWLTFPLGIAVMLLIKSVSWRFRLWDRLVSNVGELFNF